LVEVKGLVKKPSALVPNEILTILPVGYRPNEITVLATWRSGGGSSQLQIEPTGEIKLVSGNTSGVGLSFFFGLG